MNTTTATIKIDVKTYSCNSKGYYFEFTPFLPFPPLYSPVFYGTRDQFFLFIFSRYIACYTEEPEIR